MSLDLKSLDETTGALFGGLVADGLVSPSVAAEVCGILDPFYRNLRAWAAAGDWAQIVSRYWGFSRSSEAPVPMNAANLCPEPWPLIEAANRLRMAYNDDVSQQHRTVDGEPGRYVEALRTARRLVGRGLGLPDARHVDLALVRNTSEANNILGGSYRGWDPDGDDEVLIWEENHPTNRQAWHMRANWTTPDGTRPHPFKVIEVKLAPEMSSDAIAEAFTDRIGDRTRFVSFTQVSNGSGMRIPDAAIDKIWAAASARDRCHLHIDGAMTWGSLPIDLSKPRCHSMSASAHKWFLGPKETGFLYMHPSKVEHFIPHVFAYDYKITVPKVDAIGATAMERFELLGQRDDVNIIHLAAAQCMWNALGGLARPRIAALAKTLIDGLEDAGWTLITPEAAASRWAIVRFEAGRSEGARKPSLYRFLFDHGIAGSGGNTREDNHPSGETMRLCPTIYNLDAHIQRALDAAAAWRRLP